MEELRKAAEEASVAYLTEVLRRMEPLYPHFVSAVRGELAAPRLTSERWHRIASVFCSMSSIPGELLTEDEHTPRNIGLQAAHVAREMGYAIFGAKDPANRFDFIVWWAADITRRMGPG